jgi:two-component system sensor histidine kinase EvgS
MNGVLIKPLSLMSLENELLRYFQAEESTETKTTEPPKNYQDEYSFDAFENLLRESPEYILVILDEIKKVHDEVLLILNNEAIDKATFRSMVHKVKGGAQLLNAAKFVRACEALEQEGILEEQVASFRRLLEEQNHTIESHQRQFQNSFNDSAK